MRGRTRQALYYGICVHTNKITGSPVLPIPESLLEVGRHLAEAGICPVLPNAVSVEFFDAGKWMPPRPECAAVCPSFAVNRREHCLASILLLSSHSTLPVTPFSLAIIVADTRSSHTPPALVSISLPGTVASAAGRMPVVGFTGQNFGRADYLRD